MAQLAEAFQTVNEPATGSLERTPTGDEWLLVTNIASRYHLKLETLRGRLRTWQKKNPSSVGKDWAEVNDRGPREGRYFFQLGAVMHIVEALKLSGKRPAKKFSSRKRR